MRFRDNTELQAFRSRILERGAVLAPRVNWLGATRYHVPSQSSPDAGYVVDLANETCPCPSYQMLNNLNEPGLPRPRPPVRCKHLWAALTHARVRREGGTQSEVLGTSASCAEGAN